MSNVKLNNRTYKSTHGDKAIVSWAWFFVVELSALKLLVQLALLLQLYLEVRFGKVRIRPRTRYYYCRTKTSPGSNCVCYHSRCNGAITNLLAVYIFQSLPEGEKLLNVRSLCRNLVAELNGTIPPSPGFVTERAPQKISELYYTASSSK